jgi:tRNA-dihydrouridine synthase
VAELPCPVTAKIRLGWDLDNRNYREIALLLQDAGVAAITVHGRTASQGFSGQADWSAIAEVRQLVQVPVLANGDVRTPEDIDAIKRATGCEVVLIGRGAIGNPWIFSRRQPGGISWDERVIHYIQGFHGANALRPQLVAAETAEQVIQVLSTWQLR